MFYLNPCTPTVPSKLMILFILTTLNTKISQLIQISLYKRGFLNSKQGYFSIMRWTFVRVWEATFMVICFYWIMFVLSDCKNKRTILQNVSKGFETTQVWKNMIILVSKPNENIFQRISFSNANLSNENRIFSATSD